MVVLAVKAFQLVLKAICDQNNALNSQFSVKLLKLYSKHSENL